MIVLKVLGKPRAVENVNVESENSLSKLTFYCPNCHNAICTATATKDDKGVYEIESSKLSDSFIDYDCRCKNCMSED